MATTVLIIDHNRVVRDGLGECLRSAGYHVMLARNGLEGLRAFHRARPGLIVLDIDLPGMGGVLVCRRIRELADTPIMILSSQTTSEDSISAALDAGADEHLVRPMRLAEFVGRVEALLRRGQGGTPDDLYGYDDGYLRVDLRQRQVYVKGKKVHHTPVEFKVLSVLLHNAGTVVAHQELLDQVWGPEYKLDVFHPRTIISQLRRKIEPDPSRPTYIRTEHRVGYWFEKRGEDASSTDAGFARSAWDG